MNNIIETEDRPIDMCPTGYDYEQYQLSELENEHIKLKTQLGIATKALREIRKRIEDFNDDPMNKIGFMAYGTLHECLKESKKALKEMKDVK